MRPLTTTTTALLTLLAALLPPSALSADDPKAKARKQERSAAKLPPCAACTSLVQSFEKGMERTARGKFEGGDADWEERNQVAGYASSEVRFVEIEEELCKDVERGEQQCHQNHHEWEEDLEEWWRLEERARQPLRQWLCVETLRVCCPEGRYGPECKECNVKDSRGRVCSGSGKCKGEGTRKGSGKCSCHDGYTGELCDSCDVGHYQSYEDEDKRLCSACHKSCKTHCTGAGPKACVDCKEGYFMSPEEGCADIDECALSGLPCSGNRFCVNTEGSFRCSACSDACDGCDGRGPDRCLRCAGGHSLGGKDGRTCVSPDDAGKLLTLSNTRYFTYGALCLVACIIFQRSVALAGALGVVIAMYISLSEYFLRSAEF